MDLYGIGGWICTPLKIFPQHLTLILKEILQKNFALKYIKILLTTKKVVSRETENFKIFTTDYFFIFLIKNQKLINFSC